jgi:hypothetical protein
LKSATIFSSKEFESIKKSNSDFPVVAALYERDPWGMDFDYIKYFKFDIYKSNKKFTLNDILTIDGIVEKYPQKGKSSGLQFYTLRDMNALLRNAGFVENRALNGVCVSDDTLYNYAWLFFLKNNFKPKNNRFIYGNLSPLYTKKLKDDKFKNEVVSYAYNNDDLVKKYYSDKKIEELYGPIVTQYPDLSEEIDIINTLFD